MNTNEKRGVALVVDDKILVTKAVARVLGRRFETVLTANTPQEAELHLSSNHVTHLLCDFILGDGVPTGAELIPRWRTAYPGIVRAVLFTGSVLTKIVVPPEADALLSKPMSTDELFTALGLD